MNRTIYCLPGRGGRLATGLGEGLSSRGFNVTGRETVGDFRSLAFQEQIDIVAEDLRTRFWQEDARVIANSFGAYLFLHAQAQMEPYVGKVLLLSPIVGDEYFSPSWTPFQADRGCCFSGIVDGVSD